MPNASDRPKYDIFVSYARVDDDPPPGVEHGWVSTCVGAIKKYLARELGRKEYVQLWMDYELRGSDAVTPVIHEQLASTRVLLLFLSKGYLESRWCMEELNTFVERVGTDGGRIFPVYLSPVDTVPEALTGLRMYHFWKNNEKNRPRTLGDPVPSAGSEPEYYHKAQDLARDLADQLADSVAVAPAAPVATGPRVFVGGADDDRDLVRAAATALKGRGLHCLLPMTASSGFRPDTPPGRVRRDFEDNLGDSDAVVLMYRDGPQDQLRQTIREVQKQRARDERVPRCIDLCQPHPDRVAIGLSGPDLNVIVTGHDCAADCIDDLAARLAAPGSDA